MCPYILGAYRICAILINDILCDKLGCITCDFKPIRRDVKTPFTLQVMSCGAKCDPEAPAAPVSTSTSLFKCPPHAALCLHRNRHLKPQLMPNIRSACHFQVYSENTGLFPFPCFFCSSYLQWRKHASLMSCHSPAVYRLF